MLESGECGVKKSVGVGRDIGGREWSGLEHAGEWGVWCEGECGSGA